MINIRLLLKYFTPYYGSAIRNIIYNILSAIFALISYTLVIPFLNILFNRVEIVSAPGVFHFSLDYFGTFIKYYFSEFIDKQGQIATLLLVVITVIVASFFKNGFIFLANNSLAYIRASTVRGLRRKLYNKILKLPLAYFSDAWKGDVMTRISNDVQEVETSVTASLTMLIRDPMYIIIFAVYLFVSSFELTLIALALLPFAGLLIGKISRTLRSSSYRGQQNLGHLLSIVEETLTGLRIIKAFNAERKMLAKFGELNERYAKVFNVLQEKPTWLYQ